MGKEKIQEEIARVAYELYEKRGKTHGCDVDDWVEAEKIVKTRQAKSKTSAVAKAGTSTPAGRGKKKGTASGAAAGAKKTPRKKTTP